MVPALQFEGVFATAQAVDVGAQLVHALQPLRHHHLLVHQVRLRQVGAGLRTTTEGGSRSDRRFRQDEFLWFFLMDKLGSVLWIP